MIDDCIVLFLIDNDKKLGKVVNSYIVFENCRNLRLTCMAKFKFPVLTIKQKIGEHTISFFKHELPSKAYDFSLQAYLLERGSVGDFSKSYLDFNSADYDSRMDWENKGNLLRKECNKRRRLCQMNMKQFPIVYSFMQNVIILHNQRHLQIDRLVKINSVFLDLLMNLPNIPVYGLRT
ncbi:hypothetical protein ROZALSC1DRAFT_25630 [Rozella allomycis CSF55]|uniref:Uncharacterized protein n=1 Tax=Rozella allomycis (strain CSF55) TaxID=988480 RepID=A0A4P9YBA3_ROZAC|nr:hypothetical protein ROZALSC1DRAFT_25630 [Rozella allomycis CSF55]